jgi:hypothetical protein
MQLQDEGNPGNARYRRGVADETETEIVIERGVDGDMRQASERARRALLR